MKVGSMELEVRNAMLEVGAPAPGWSLSTPRNQARTSAEYAGKVKVISCVPSIDTRVCSAQTRRFNVEAAGLSDDIVVLTVSADLPYALGRYCATEGIDKTETLSCHLDMGFADAYGVHVVPWRICQRAVFVVDKEDVLRYAQYMPAMGDEVDFTAALDAARALA
ncbi:MAG: thiol peroxidase [Chloroflexi bacterium]|nr:thiol peroxidase [Chloroflexota bacterium]